MEKITQLEKTVKNRQKGPVLTLIKAPYTGAGAGWSQNRTRPEFTVNYSQPANALKIGTGMNEVGTSKA